MLSPATAGTVTAAAAATNSASTAATTGANAAIVAATAAAVAHPSSLKIPAVIVLCVEYIIRLHSKRDNWTCSLLWQSSSSQQCNMSCVGKNKMKERSPNRIVFRLPKY